MKIAMGSDHAGFPLKEEIKKVLLEQGYEVEDVGCYSRNASITPSAPKRPVIWW